jgi:hypothetical protein
MLQSCSERSTRGCRLVTRIIVRMKPTCRKLVYKKLGRNMQMSRGQVTSCLANISSSKNLLTQSQRSRCHGDRVRNISGQESGVWDEVDRRSSLRERGNSEAEVVC